MPFCYLQQEVTRTNFLWLKLHLTVVDLLVILCYCPSHIAWLIGYTWSAGEFLCKAMQYSWSAHCIASCCLLAIYIHYYQGLLFPLDVVRSFIHCIGQATDRLWPDADGTDGQNGRRCLSADSFREGIPRLGMGSGRLTTPRCFPADDRPCLSAPHSLLLSWRRTRFIASVFCLDNH